MANARERALLGLGESCGGPIIFHAAGCERCEGQGYRGRVAIVEILRFDDELDEIIARRGTPRDLVRAARARGFTTLAENGARRVLDGLASLDELCRVIDLTGGPRRE